MLELARFPEKEARFRKEMERLRNATRRDLTLEVGFPFLSIPALTSFCRCDLSRFVSLLILENRGLIFICLLRHLMSGATFFQV